jgi:hypothetical protein
VAAVLGPLLALIGTELRRSLLLAGSGAVALALLGLLQPAAAAAGFTGVLAVALGRTGALLAGSAAAAAMRTADLRQMGGGLERMRLTAAALLLSTAVFSLGPAAAAAWRARTLVWLPLAAGLFLVALAGWRVALAVATGPLRRRRAFEPERVREAQPALFGAAVLAALVGLAAACLPFFTAWVAFLDPSRHDLAPVGTYVLALVPVLAGVALAAVLFVFRKDRSLALAGLLGARLGTAWAVSDAVLGRFLGRPGSRAIDGVEGRGLPAAEAALGRAVAGTGALAGRPLPWLALAAAGAVALAVVFGLIGSGARL